MYLNQVKKHHMHLKIFVFTWEILHYFCQWWDAIHGAWPHAFCQILAENKVDRQVLFWFKIVLYTIGKPPLASSPATTFTSHDIYEQIKKQLKRVSLHNVLFTSADPNNEPYGGVWIGLNDVVTEGSFHWSDGSQLTYSKWATGQPDNKNGYQNCVEMVVHGGNWMDTSCGRQLPFICQKDVWRQGF